MPNQNQAILSRIKQRAQERKISLRALSLRAGAGPDLVRDWQGPKAPLPRLDSLKQVANVLGVSAGWLAFGEDSPMPDIQSVRVISWVAAGLFKDTGGVDFSDETQTLQISGLPRGKYFGLNVRGDSMNLVAPENSVIIVNADDQELQPRKHYVFMLDGEATFKQYMSNPERLEPLSTNREYEALPFENNVTVIGRVVRVLNEL